MAKRQDDNTLLGEAAEHLVLSRLLIRGYVATQGPRGVKSYDLFVTSGIGTHFVIQVKGNRKGLKVGWIVGRPESGYFYALVDYSDESAPVVYVLPSEVVRSAVDAEGEVIRRRTGREPDNLRKIRDPWRLRPSEYEDGWLAQYREAWSLLPESERS
jgi:hypothetical protein